MYMYYGPEKRRHGNSPAHASNQISNQSNIHKPRNLLQHENPVTVPQTGSRPDKDRLGTTWESYILAILLPGTTRHDNASDQISNQSNIF